MKDTTKHLDEIVEAFKELYRYTSKVYPKDLTLNILMCQMVEPLADAVYARKQEALDQIKNGRTKCEEN